MQGEAVGKTNWMEYGNGHPRPCLFAACASAVPLGDNSYTISAGPILICKLLFKVAAAAQILEDKRHAEHRYGEEQ